ncbi:MAG: alpha/beta hydrolase [Phascolarctobacterium sp.]|nr:alpha/beta hydrolase [Phascolarctobacterium sp.]
MNKKIFSSILFAAAMTASTLAFANETVLEIPITQHSVKYISNVVYEQVPSRGFANVPMKMDVMVPDVKEKAPAIVFVTGGGFINANKDNYLQQRMFMANNGYVVASIEYRVAPTATFPQPLEDVKAAIRYLRANATKFNVDAEHIGLFGGSAGGYLVGIAGTTNGLTQFDKGENLEVSSEVQAVVDIYGISDLTRIGMDYDAENQKRHTSPGATEALWVLGSPVFGGVDGGILNNPEKVKAAQPINYITKKTPPYLIMAGTDDKVVSPSQSNILYDALKAKGVDATLYKVKNAAHGGVYWVQPEITKLVLDFFDKHLKNK